MEIEYKDLPLWAKQSIEDFLPHKRPRVHVVIGETVKLSPIWHEACQRRITMYKDGQTKSIDSCYYTTFTNNSTAEFAAYEGGDGQLPLGGMLLEILTFPPTARLYVRPENMPEQIKEPAPRLTEFQLMVLSSYVCYTSAGRKDSLSRYHIPKSLFDKATEELASMNLVKVTGAGVGATREGRNLYNDNRSNHRSWYSWENEFDFSEQTGYRYKAKEGSWVAEIIEKYSKKIPARR